MLVNVAKLNLYMVMAIVQFKCNEATGWIVETDCFNILSFIAGPLFSDSFVSQFDRRFRPFSRDFVYFHFFYGYLNGPSSHNKPLNCVVKDHFVRNLKSYVRQLQCH